MKPFFFDNLKIPRWKTALAFSVAVHLFVVLLVFLLPVEKIEKSKELIARLVTPEEMEKPEELPPEIKPGALLPLPPAVERIKPAPLRPPLQPSPPPKVLRSPFPPAVPKPPSPEEPLVPQEGKEDGKLLPDDSPKSGSRDREGEEQGRKDLTKSKTDDKPGYLKRKELLDKDVIDEIAKKEVAERQKRDNTVTLDTTEFRYAGYMEQLKARFEGSGCWIYPAEAARRGIYGDLRVNFTIRKNGSLGEVDLVRTSGHQLLDDAAIRALKDCGPYWPLPDEWGRDSIEIPAHFIYSIYGAFIR